MPIQVGAYVLVEHGGTWLTPPPNGLAYGIRQLVAGLTASPQQSGGQVERQDHLHVVWRLVEEQEDVFVVGDDERREVLVNGVDRHAGSFVGCVRSGRGR